ncbi:glycosyltransferase [Sphingomonas sp.]|uniref:glycosyltransferase n=1 Tax=Sphingomonas sp. TaxID=28214 RepID=UPI0025DC3D1F|nr:glycosyltransferase [Sphingomonas sp.]
MSDKSKRILFVQPGGDYRAAYHRLIETGTETYYGHRYVLSILEALLAEGEVAMMCCRTEERYVDVLPNGVTVIGAAAHPRKGAADIRRQMAAWNPTHVVVLGPMSPLIRWAIRTNRRVICQLADSFNYGMLTLLRKHGLLARLLNDRRVEWVTNHGVNACRSLAGIGVDPDKIIAWDYPHVRRPDDLPPRTDGGTGGKGLLYVGTIQPDKGVGDVIDAIAELRRRGTPARLRIVGAGQVDRFRALAEQRGVAGDVDFLGLVTNADVFALMREASAIVVPSRHVYPEGLPLTIYEALCARTPIIASDHPMFSGHLVHRKSALVFRAGQATELADQFTDLLSDPDLYARLSESAPETWRRMQNPVKWGDVIRYWIADDTASRTWLSDHRLEAIAGTGSVEIRAPLPSR